EARLTNGPWWYGETWSAVDGYLYWVWGRITGVGYPDTDYPNLRQHFHLSNERPAIQRAMAREAENIEILKSEGLFIPPR
ncbi:MAG: glutathione S-transferase C-terminal domain-containing protein, partial [Pseudomonadota bacterium]